MNKKIYNFHLPEIQTDLLIRQQKNRTQWRTFRLTWALQDSKDVRSEPAPVVLLVLSNNAEETWVARIESDENAITARCRPTPSWAFPRLTGTEASFDC